MKKLTTKTAATKMRGNLTTAEITPLVMAARTAYDFQSRLSNVDGQDFNTWRHEQCMASVGKPGITACSHDHYRALMAHFQILAVRDEKAFQNLTTTGQASKQQGDTHETRRTLAYQILEAVKTSDTIQEGYVVWLVRQKTRRPDLQLGKDLATGLAERCTASQLTQIRDTIINRIAAKERRGHPVTRNRKQSSQAKAARSPKNLDLQPHADPAHTSCKPQDFF
jgi:hypothetical protein